VSFLNSCLPEDEICSMQLYLKTVAILMFFIRIKFKVIGRKVYYIYCNGNALPVVLIWYVGVMSNLYAASSTTLEYLLF
jgi:hypothetical protein